VVGTTILFSAAKISQVFITLCMETILCVVLPLMLLKELLGQKQAHFESAVSFKKNLKLNSSHCSQDYLVRGHDEIDKKVSLVNSKQFV